MKNHQLVLLTLVAMLAFAGNSLLCRLALLETNIDAASFTTIRLASGALMLWLVSGFKSGFESGFESGIAGSGRGNWSAALMLFAYAAAFSYAYISLPAGTGALILFGAVQLTMIGYGLINGEYLRRQQWLGLILAIAGLTALLWPGLRAPEPMAAALMMIAGLSWGIYSLLGIRAGNPIAATAGNFLRSVPMALLLLLFFRGQILVDGQGVVYALISGALTSGLGYVIWYTVLPALKSAQASVVQLSVPIITAVGGVLLLGEEAGFRLVLCTLMILGGITLVMYFRRSQPR